VLFTQLAATVNFTKVSQHATIWLFDFFQLKEFHLSDSIQSNAKINTTAIVALIASFLIAPLGVILGHVALNKIKSTGERGRLLAVWALILGYIAVAGYVFLIIGAVTGANMAADAGM